MLNCVLLIISSMSEMQCTSSQPGTDQHENLVKWNEVINEMSQVEYDEYWTKLHDQH